MRRDVRILLVGDGMFLNSYYQCQQVLFLTYKTQFQYIHTFILTRICLLSNRGRWKKHSNYFTDKGGVHTQCKRFEMKTIIHPEH